MTKMGLYRYWGDSKPDTSRPLLTLTRATDAVTGSATQTDAAGDSPGTATLRIYGPIDSYGGWWGVSAKEVAQALDQLGDAKKVIVRVNSPGGESAEGRAIMNLLRAHPAECVGVVDGAAYSAASYIAVGCDETVMSPGTTMMIHDTSTFAYGNAEAMRKAADVLDILSNSGAELYAEVAGGTVEEWRERQRAETWYTAAGAVEAGLADRVAVIPDAGAAETAGDDPDVVEPDDVEERARATYDLSLFDGAPPKPPAASAPGQPNTPTKKEGSAPVSDFTDAELTAMRQQLGLPDTADASTIVAALSEALAEQVDDKPDKPGAPKIADGMVLMSKADVDALKESGAAGTQALEKLRTQERDAYLESRRDRFLPASRESWARQYDLDPDTTREHLDAAEPIIPLSEQGHGGSDEDQAPTDVRNTDEYKEWKL